MATRKSGGEDDTPKVSTLTKDLLKTVRPIAIEEEMKDSYLTYAMSVIVSRALPDVRDGLKPVHRRALYAMNTLGMTSDKPYKKSATIVGEVLGKYHPHGDAALYDTIVRMAQDFSMRYPLVDGQGNFGSVDGDPPAAMRYTESRMSKIASELLQDIQKETVDFVPNFDDTRTEPSVMPAGFPNLLVNGGTGIAIGMATNMPPHNLKEVITAIDAYIDNPKIELKELMKFVPGPDFPTAGIIYGKEGIKKAYTTGRGSIKVRARIDLEEKKGKEVIVVTEIPYAVKKADMIVKIADLVKAGKIDGVSMVRDESDRRGMRVVIELKKGVMTQIVLNQLYKHTPLESTFGIINLALVNGEPKVLTLKEMIELFVKHRVEVVTRRTQYDLKQAEARAHIVEGLLIAQANIDEVIKIIRESKDTEQARERLMSRFKLSEIQAQAILDMPLKRLTALEHEKLETELKELQKLIAHYKDLLAHPKKILGVIKKELTEISEKYGDARRSEIVGKTADSISIDSEDLIHDEEIIVTITKQGFIKRTLASSYRAQSRGGVGVSGGKTKGEDHIMHMFSCSTKDTILFVTDKGKAFWMKAHEIPAMTKSAQGKSIKFILNLMPNEQITSYLTVKDMEADDQTMVMATKNGVLKKMALTQLMNAKKRGILALKLDSTDELIDVNVVGTGDDFIMTTKNGLALRLNEAKVRAMGRAAAGVRGIRLDTEDSCVSCTAIRRGETLIVITEKGIGKRLSTKRFQVKGRGGKGQIYIKTDAKTGPVARVKAVRENDDIVIVTDEDMLIKVHASEISEMGRNAKGVKIVNAKDEASVMDMAIVPNE